ncbi:hypothetical protein ACJ73_02303 [Blastomyces percursus]|uniref:N-acetyltransferase domain-containing protein n=1 Tax=Blastomyces percursus TaxID=1658174 RepID=A0A1J9RF98_9EURO|nr:hypothetical protein ACJ73_02303 [Blastomyces percursus]
MASLTKVIRIPQTLLSSYMGALCQRYKTARLRALKEDPQAFSSTYDKESQFDDSVWAERLQNPQAKTFVTLRAEETGGAESSEIEQLSANEWLGMIVLLGPRALPTDGSESKTPWKPFLAASDIDQPLDLATIADSEAAYVAFSMFVLAEARRQGLGRKLVQTSVEAARAEAMSMGATRANIGLWAEAQNEAARKLYEGCGFRLLPHDPAMDALENPQVAMGKLLEFKSDGDSE